MRTAFPVQELPVRSALTVAANCGNRTRKHAASVTAYSVLRAYLSIQCSTRSLHQQTTENVESEKGLKKAPKILPSDVQSFFQIQTNESGLWKRRNLSMAPLQERPRGSA